MSMPLADLPVTRMPPDRAPWMAALATATTMLAVAGFWAMLGLLGSNGMNGANGVWFLFGHIGAGLLALLLSPWLAAWLCRRARRRGWHATLAVTSATLVALGITLPVLLVASLVLVFATTP